MVAAVHSQELLFGLNVLRLSLGPGRPRPLVLAGWALGPTDGIVGTEIVGLCTRTT